MCKIRINHNEKALINTKTAEIFRPSCFDTMALLHSYYLQRGHQEKADELLKRVFKGEKVISDMVEKAQKHHLS